MSTIWVVRNDALGDELFEGGFISIGWDCVGDMQQIGPDMARITALLEHGYPNAKRGAFPVWAGILKRFAFEMEIGDVVVYPVKETGTLNFGRVTGGYFHEPTGTEHHHRRPVEWLMRDVPRLDFPQEVLNGINVPLTLFKVAKGANAFLDFLHLPATAPTHPEVPVDDTEEAVSQSIDAEQVRQHTVDFVARVLLNEISHHAFEEFTADLLRTLGYQARVTPYSADGGVDVIAHKDALGLEAPLIKVQCKHTVATQSRPDVQRLLGALSPTGNEVGLFVTLGAYSKDAVALERERHNLRLLTGPDIVALTLESYAALPVRWRDLLPLRPTLVVDRAVESQ